MNRVFVTLFLLLALACTGGVTTLHQMVVARKNAVAGCDPYADIGTSEFYWTGDFDLDCGGAPTATEKLIAITSSSTTKTGTLSSATISSDVSESTSTEHNGTWIFDMTADNQELAWTVTSGDIFDDEQGYISLYVYFTHPFANPVRFFEVGPNGANFMMFYLTGSSYPAAMRIEHEANDVTIRVIAAGSFTTNQWYHVEAKWDASRCSDGNGFCSDAGEDELSVRINDGSWEGDTDSDDMIAFVGDPGPVRIGANIFASGNNTVYVDDLRIDTSYP